MIKQRKSPRFPSKQIKVKEAPSSLKIIPLGGLEGT
jgi:hypothetical protein